MSFEGLEQGNQPIGEGLRYNKDKTRFDLLEPYAIQQLAKVFTKGAEKYEDNNWLKGMSWMSVVASLERHLNAFKQGIDYDKDPNCPSCQAGNCTNHTGLLHTAHIAWNAMALTSYYKYFPQGDDRFKKQTPKIGLDIDEILCDWLGGWMEMKGMTVRPTSWLFDRDIVNTFNAMEQEGTLNNFMLGLKPLMKPEDIPFEPHCYITARRIPNEITTKWLDMYGFPTAPVYTVPPNTTKVQVAKDSGLDIFVDDNYKNYTELNNAGVLCYLWDQPHNQRYDVGYKRINNLNQLPL